MKPAALALGVLWLALAAPHLSTRYSYDWDSSQFERGVAHFDIARHQPHPPGYPLWILTLKGLTLFIGRVNAAQVLLAMAFTMVAVVVFFSLAREMLGDPAGLAAAAALAFSPVVCMHAMVPLTYAVDLFASAMAGWMAARLWIGEMRWAPVALCLTAIIAGFRPSGGVFLAPLLVAAMWRWWRKHPGYAAGGLLAGAIGWLAWYLPTARLTGGIARLSALDHTQLMSALRATSIFFGATFKWHAGMIVEVGFYFALALVGLALPLVVSWLQPPQALSKWPGWATPWFFAWWLGPNLAMILLFHCPKSGYILLSVPPAVLLVSRWAQGALQRWPWTLAVVAACLLASYFPYERFINPAVPTAAYQFLRASPRLPGLVEDTQQQIRTLIDDLAGPAEQKLIYCLRRWTEAPNIRTVTYEYQDVNWADFEGEELRFFPAHRDEASTQRPARISAVAWLCDGAGLSPEMQARFPQARRVAGNPLFSWWISAPPPK